MARVRRRGFSETAPKKRATNVSLDPRLLEEARALKVNVSQAAARGLTLQIVEERARRWRHENKGAVDAWNAYVEEHGLPLARHRRF